jgi:cell division protein FtsI (penicillin-binding protein 3)
LDLTFADVIAQSSNVGTLKVAQELGKEKLHDYLAKFGYGQRTGIDFPGESSGMLPDVKGWWTTSMGTIPIGQGVAVTPLQMTSVLATIANGGVAVTPHLVLATVDARGNRVPVSAPKQRSVIDESTSARLTEILLGVTEKKNGTGKLARVPGYQVAGKTGSADRVDPASGGYQGYVTSFIGFAPAGDPQLAIGVIIDYPSVHFGSVTAAPAFKEVMQFALRHLGIGPGPVLPTEGTPLPGPVRSGGESGSSEISALPAGD